jgi:hypothetical protein
MGQMEMKCIFNIRKNISIWAKITQVSNVVYEPLVCLVMEYHAEKMMENCIIARIT